MTHDEARARVEQIADGWFPEARPTVAQREQVALLDGLRAYVQWHGAAHDCDCPGDDTCDCSCRAANDAVNTLCRMGHPTWMIER